MPLDIDGIMSGKVGSDPNINNTWVYKSIHNENLYEFMSNAYHGTGGFRTGEYLIPHMREPDYTNRRDGSFYRNFVKPIVDAMIVPVFGKTATRKVEPDTSLFSEFLENCDNCGMPLQKFTQGVCTTSRMHGVSFIIMDNLPQDQLPATQVEAEEQRAYPYVYERRANEVVAYKLDLFGKILSITFKDTPVNVTSDKGETTQEERWRRWTTMTVEVLRKNDSDEYEVVTTHTHGLGVIPVVVLYSTRKLNYTDLLVDPPLYDLATVALALFNKDSEIRSQERSQGFSVFFCQADKPGNLTIGDKNVLFVPMGATLAPGYASPDPAILQGLVANGKELMESLYRLAQQHGVTGVTDESGIAKAWDFQAHEAVLKQSVDMAEWVEEQLSWLFGLYTGETFEYTVEYQRSFQPFNKIREVETYIKILSIPNIAEAIKDKMTEKMVRMMLSEEPQEAVDELIEEVKASEEAKPEPSHRDEEPVAEKPPVPEEDIPETRMDNGEER